jgi:hypothetical protein
MKAEYDGGLTAPIHTTNVNGGMHGVVAGS